MWQPKNDSILIVIICMGIHKTQGHIRYEPRNSVIFREIPWYSGIFREIPWYSGVPGFHNAPFSFNKLWFCGCDDLKWDCMVHICCHARALVSVDIEIFSSPWLIWPLLIAICPTRPCLSIERTIMLIKKTIGRRDLVYPDWQINKSNPNKTVVKHVTVRETSQQKSTRKNPTYIYQAIKAQNIASVIKNHILKKHYTTSMGV